MIQYNENPENKINKIIKLTCRIKSVYYYIRIYINGISINKRIIFLIKCSPDKINFTLYKRSFYYEEIIRYNKNFGFFSSLDDIFVSISQSIQENKFMITNTIKYLSLVMRIYIQNINKYSNININLNNHKNINQLSMPKFKRNEIQKVTLGITNEKELTNIIKDIRNRIKIIEKNQSRILLSNYNINNTNINNITSEKIAEQNENIKNNIRYTENPNNINNINKNNSNFIKKSIDKNNNINKNDNDLNQNNNMNNFKNASNIDTSNINKINITDLNSDKMAGINEMLMNKLNNLENLIQNKDNKIKGLESRLNYLNTSVMNSSRNPRSVKFRNISKEQQISKESKDISKINAVSTINRSTDKNVLFSQNIPYDPNYYQRKHKNKYLKTSSSAFNDNSDLNNESKIEAKRNKHKRLDFSIDNYNNKKFNQSNSESQQNEFIDNSKNIYNNNEISRKEKKKYPIIMAKGFGHNKSHTMEKQKNLKDISYENENGHKKHHHHHHHHQDLSVEKPKSKFSLIKVKSNHKSNSIKKSGISYNDSSINIITNNHIIESEANNNFSYINKDNYNEEKIEKNIIKDKINSSKKINNNEISDSNEDINKSFTNNKKLKNKIPIYPKENIRKYVNSKIIFRKDELRLLKDKISNNDRKLHVFFDLLYRASQDGDQEIIIRDSIEGYYETLTLFYTKEGARFGVYLKREEVKSFMRGKYFKEVPGSCFIVGLNNLKIYQIDRNKISNGNFREVLCFGRTYYLNKNGTNWIIYTPQNNFLGKKCRIGNGEGLFRKLNVENLLGEKEYHIKEVEIFSVAIERFYLEKK